jgi:hypothetical protein
MSSKQAVSPIPQVQWRLRRLALGNTVLVSPAEKGEFAQKIPNARAQVRLSKGGH